MSESLVRALLKDNPIAYKPILAKALGGVTVGLWMSQLMYWSDKGSDAEGWIYKTRDDWAGETAMGPYEIVGARKRALELGVVEEKLAKVPAKLHYRICWEKLEQVVSQYVEEHPQKAKAQYREKPKSSIGKNPILELGKTQNKIEEKPNTITETTTETTQRKEPASSFSNPAETVGAIYRAWQDNSRGTTNQLAYAELSDLIDEHGAALVFEGLRETIANIGEPTIPYLSAVLRNWKGRVPTKKGGPPHKPMQQIEPGVWRA